MIEPKITAIILIYNSEKTIKVAIRSIQNQNMADIEILLIDDFSSEFKILCLILIILKNKIY